MKSLKFAVLVAATMLGTVQVQASSYTASEVINAGQSHIFTSGAINAGSSSFDDSYTFTLGNGTSGANFLFNIGLPGSPITSFFVNYLSGSVSVSGGNVNNNYFDPDEGVTFWLLDKAEYTFALSGLSTGAKTISVSGTFATPFETTQNYSLTVSAVPEPESFALMLAGLGMMAAVARRKSKNN